MSGWFDEEPDKPVRPALSPTCEAGDCAGCPGWWWTVHKQVARTCGHDCHQPTRAASAASAAVAARRPRALGVVRAPRLGACPGWAGPWRTCS